MKAKREALAQEGQESQESTGPDSSEQADILAADGDEDVIF